MFSKLKQTVELRNQAKKMQNALSGEKVELEKDGVKIIMNGNMEVVEFSINNNLDKNEIAKISKNLFNESIKKTQKIMAKKMQEMGGFPGLS